MARINTFRALSFVFGSQIVRRAGLALLAAAAAILLIVLALAYFFSDWWLVLLIPYAVCVVVVLVVYVIARVVLTTLYPHKLTPSQKNALVTFNAKVLRLLETRAMTPWMIGAVVIKDLVVHRELTTLRQLLNDSVSLKKDFAQLEENLETGGKNS